MKLGSRTELVPISWVQCWVLGYEPGLLDYRREFT